MSTLFGAFSPNESKQEVTVHMSPGSEEGYYTFIKRKYSEKLQLLETEFTRELERGEQEIAATTDRIARADCVLQCLHIQLAVVEQFAATEGQAPASEPPFLYACCLRGAEHRRSLFGLLSAPVEEEPAEAKLPLLHASRGDWIRVLQTNEDGWWVGENISREEKGVQGLIAAKHLQVSAYLGTLHRTVDQKLSELRNKLEEAAQREYEGKEKRTRFTRRTIDRETRKARALEIIAEVFSSRMDLLAFTDLAVARESLQAKLLSMRKEMTMAIDLNCRVVLECGKVQDRWEAADRKSVV